MTTVAPPAFYDAALPNVLAREDRYRALYDAALGLVPEGSSVVELGCGAGRFAKLLLASGRVTGYLGIDFAPETVAEARQHVGVDVFRVGDLRTAEIPAADCYVVLEVLEHLADDLALLERLPTGELVVLIVPSFDSASHVRHFPGPDDAAARYSAVLAIESTRHIPVKRSFFHLIAGRRL